MSNFRDLTLPELKACLKSPQTFLPPWPVPPAANLRKAAVLIPFQCAGDSWQILFTRRTDTVQDHKGQVAFPGGAQDIDDLDEIDTALREAKEEIGLNPADVNILGRMGDVPTMSNYLISPIAAVIPHPYQFYPSINEVNRIFTIPLEWLADPANHFEKQRTLQDGTVTRVIYFNEYDGELLWGISAYITLCLIDLINLGKGAD